MHASGQHLFVSYRRAPPGSAAGLPARLQPHLRRRWQGAGEVFFDLETVQGPARFATDLVDVALNRSQVLLVVIDEAWLSPGNVARLHDTQHDWVRFEIVYALSFELVVIPIVRRARLAELLAAPLPEELALLLHDPRRLLVMETGESLADMAGRIRAAAVSSLRGHTRRPSTLRAQAEHNQARKPASVDELDDALAGPAGWKRRLLRLADSGNGWLQLAFWLSLPSWLFFDLLPLPQLATLLLGVAWRCGPGLRWRHLQALAAR